MSRYDSIWADAVQGAIETLDVSLDRLIRQARTAGMSTRAIEQRLINDILNDGPIFGPFMRSMAGAATSSVLAAERQGNNLGQLEALQRIANIDGVIDEADPELMDEIEREFDDLPYMWRATLTKTCHLCLPLHGKVMTMAEWRELGVLPSTIHADQGWNSACKCTLEPAEGKRRSDEVEPILRTAQKGQKRTARNLTQSDIEKAIAKRDELLQSDKGRQVLRLLGQSQKGMGDASQ